MEDRFELLTTDGTPIPDPGTAQEKELLAAIEALPSETARADAFCWLTGWVTAAAVQRALLRILERENDATSVAEMVDCLDELPAIPQALGRGAWEIFRSRFESRSEHRWMRSQALRGALAVAQGDPSLVRRLQSYLLDVTADDDSAYLRHVAKVAGAILRRYPDDDFRDLLSRLVEVDAASDEAALELGLDRLQEGLLARTYDALTSALAAAQDWFRRSLAMSEERSDAALYEICTSVLIDVQARGLHSELSLDLPKLRRAAIEYSAYATDRHSAESWLGTSSRERFHWLSMATKLAMIAHTFTKDIWLQAAIVIEDELLSIFFASEKVFSRSDGNGADILGREALVHSLRKRRYYLQTLDQWLAEKADSDLALNVGQLRDTVQQSLAGALHRSPFDESTGGRLVDFLTHAGLDEATAAMTAAQLDVGIDRNQQVAALWTAVMEKLSDSPDYKREHPRALLELMCTLILRFLDFRANIGKSTDPSSEYVFRRGADLPVEHDLQLDFLRFLTASDAPSFRAEVRDSGGGRADIAIEYRGVKSTVEVKKDDNVPDNAALAKRYAGQATGYLTTGVRFGFLLVLDLTDRSGHQPHLSEQISVERKVPAGSEVEYHIVVARIQAKRKTPHDLR
ncbi:hypothetical protein Nham_0784 [Nitrobacter hamburgensis X14]|uniref:Uncharacterized protein n=1 Tax=Nitrobacter hamburgensis (strain DSM 10229 / NCIMB 13809 / X14) TaxID=323097 RepID=Q1QQ34_NITHX|nr:hypothetical protein [Nitrobacter hamburgensis]ABE61663.1 hypothetical protein Nham_0784 [Nitrobacter hamburgensis X14]